MLKVFLCITLCLVGVHSQGPRVVIDQGELAGRVMPDKNGDNIYAFQRIPYGKPPINELRFKVKYNFKILTKNLTRCIPTFSRPSLLMDGKV